MRRGALPRTHRAACEHFHARHSAFGGVLSLSLLREKAPIRPCLLRVTLRRRLSLSLSTRPCLSFKTLERERRTSFSRDTPLFGSGAVSHSALVYMSRGILFPKTQKCVGNTRWKRVCTSWRVCTSSRRAGSCSRRLCQRRRFASFFSSVLKHSHIYKDSREVSRERVSRVSPLSRATMEQSRETPRRARLRALSLSLSVEMCRVHPKLAFQNECLEEGPHSL